MLRVLAIFSGLFISAAIAVSPANAVQGPGSSRAGIELEAVFQNDDIYQGATGDAGGNLIELHVNMRKGTTTGHMLRFGGLGDVIRGDSIEILDARLELYYADEYWTLIKYHVAASRSLDGSADHVDPEPEGSVTVLGDKWPPGEKTRRPSWVSLPIRPETVQAWVEDEKNNHGLLLHVPQANRGLDQKLMDLRLASADPGTFFVGFRSTEGWRDKHTPRLVVRYRVKGNVPPSPPGLGRVPGNAKVYSKVDIHWLASEDPNPGDAVRYEFQAGSQAGGGEISWSKATAAIRGARATWSAGVDRDRLYKGTGLAGENRKLWYRVRAIDSTGGNSGWKVAGPVTVTDRPWTVWGTHGNHKIWPDIQPLSKHGAGISIQAARNEWEPFQVVVMSHAGLEDVRIKASKLGDKRGNVLSAPTVFREHYLPIADTANKTYGHLGLVPDALVPLIHPRTGKPTGGKYGGNVFAIPAGGLEAFWLDMRVGQGTPAGIYHGSVQVSGKGVETVTLPVQLEVFDFTLPSPKHLMATFELNGGSVVKSHGLKSGGKANKEKNFSLMHDYEEMLHEHLINNWSPVSGFNYGLARAKVEVSNGKVSVDWSKFDELVGPYMDGSAYKDKVPAQSLFVPYWIPVRNNKGDTWARKVNRHNYKNIDLDLFAQYISELQRHLKQKGWSDRAFVFYFDEPFISAWKYEAFIQTSKVIRRVAPDLRILITDGYREPGSYKKKAYITEPLEPYVDVWDPVTFQVSSLEKVEYYRKRKAAGKFDMWCQTLANANPRRAVINLFPEYDMPFHRMWGVMSWNFGFQGIEWWETIIWWDQKTRKRLDPWTNPVAFPGFRQPLNSDGRLFFPGTPDAIGGPDMPVSSLRMKAVREAIEDYEYLYLLDQAGRGGSFDIDILHTTDANKSKAMKSPMPMGKGPWQWWEGNADVLMAAREKIARMIVATRGAAGGN